MASMRDRSRQFGALATWVGLLVAPATYCVVMLLAISGSPGVNVTGGIAPGVLPPPRVASGQYWYVESVGMFATGPVGRPRGGHVRLEQWIDHKGRMITRWEILRMKHVSYTEVDSWPMRLAYRRRRALPSSPTELAAAGRVAPRCRSTQQVFTLLSWLAVWPTVVHASVLAAIRLLPGVSVKHGAVDGLGRRGTTYRLGSQSITVNEQAGTILSLGNRRLTRSFVHSIVVTAAPRLARNVRPPDHAASQATGDVSSAPC